MSPSRKGYRVTDEATADLNSIAAYIAHDRPSAARRVLAALRATFGDLAANPLIGTSCEHLGASLRRFSSNGPARRYVIFFRPVDSGVEIVAVIDGSRDWESLLGVPGST